MEVPLQCLKWFLNLTKTHYLWFDLVFIYQKNQQLLVDALLVTRPEFTNRSQKSFFFVCDKCN